MRSALAALVLLPAAACAPVSYVESDHVVRRTIVESAPRRERARDDTEVTVYVEGDHVLVRVERIGACTVEVVEEVALEHTRRAEPDKTFIVLDQVALYAGAIAAVTGVAYGAACLSHNGTSCAPAAPLVAGGLGLEIGGAIALFADSAKRRTTATPRRELHTWEPSVRACARAPLSGMMVSLVPDVGPSMRAVADATGLAAIPLGGRRPPFDVELRLDERPFRRQRVQ